MLVWVIPTSVGVLSKAMRKMPQVSTGIAAAEKKWMLPLLASFLVTLILLMAGTSGFRGHSEAFYRIFSLGRPASESGSTVLFKGPGSPPVLAYLISGTRGDGERMKRLLSAVYHPRNQYLLHLDGQAPDAERVKLALYANSDSVFRAMNNVNVIGKADTVTYMGSTAIASTLHAAAILLRISTNWDWLITLSALDYPLITQDDLLYVLSYLPRDLNFIEHTSDLGWKEYQRAKPIIIDPGLYLSKKSEIFYTSQRREMPDAYKVFTGSPWVVLSRNFMEYCVLGWDNLPRTVLMYFSNVVLSQEGYFHTVICNAPEFKNTTVNSDLRYLVWDIPPKPEPHYLDLSDFQAITENGAAFARQFHQDDPVLDKIDRIFLKRRQGRLAPGGWCEGKFSKRKDPCSQWGNINVLKPGPRVKLFEKLILNLIANETFRSNQCRF